MVSWRPPRSELPNVGIKHHSARSRLAARALDNKYCVHCTDVKGNLKPYEAVLENLQAFAIRNMGVSETEALKMAQEGMSKLPAWEKIQ